MDKDKFSQSDSDLISDDNMTAVIHFYRGEMDRMNTWRRRLDVTTNWAIITTAAFISFGFGSPRITHFVFVLATIFVLIFLFIEARRYKYYDLWRWRVALVDENFFGPMFSGYRPVMEDWREHLGSDLQHSRFKITFGEAFGRRLRRNYSWIFLVLGGCWLTKISIHPKPISNILEIVDRAAIYEIVPGLPVIITGVLFNLGLVAIALLTLRERKEEVKIYPSKRSKIKLPNI